MLHIPHGYLIALEGIDGCGKTTLTAQLARLLSDKGVAVVTTREPGQTGLGMKIRALIQERSVPMCPQAEYLLFAANRAQHFHEFILPQLSSGNVIISDRFFDSSLVYQGYARGLELDTLRTINYWVTQGRMPDLVIYVRVTPALAADRIKKRGAVITAYEKESDSFINKLFQGYESLVAPRQDVLVVDGSLDPVSLAQETAASVYELLCRKGMS
ncbi:dTMP kinase [Candidatus Dependentiae bacterium]|nr:dTMP kinase [Candidatus Dependentiae bacterium]MCC7415346.1 dTMP kinase [Campylobacterota bacterium]